MRAAAASGKVIVPEGENDGLTSSADSAQFQSDELEVRDPLILFLTFQNCGTYHTASISGGCPFSACDSRAEVDARSVSPPKGVHDRWSRNSVHHHLELSVLQSSSEHFVCLIVI